jgi:hypothetical protein
MLKQILTVGVKARFTLREINDLWVEYLRQSIEHPDQELFHVGDKVDWRKPKVQEVWVKVDRDRSPATATVLMAGEF